MMPMKIDWKPRFANSLVIASGVEELISAPLEVYLSTVLNKMMETASLVIPSPKTILNSFGF